MWHLPSWIYALSAAAPEFLARYRSGGNSDGAIAAKIFFLVSAFGVALILKYLKAARGRDDSISDFIGFSKSELKRMDRDPNNTVKPRDADFVYINNRTDEITRKIKNHDPDFNKVKFINFSRKVISILHDRFGSRLTDKTTELDIRDVFAALESEGDIESKDYTPPMGIDIKSVFFSHYDMRNGFEYITVIFYVEYFDELYSDDPYRQYAVKFARFTNNLVGYVNTHGSVTCPNCGGNGESIITDGICGYCGYRITLGGHRFIFSDFKKILKDEDIYDTSEDISPFLMAQLGFIKKSKEKEFRDAENNPYNKI